MMKSILILLTNFRIGAGGVLFTIFLGSYYDYNEYFIIPLVIGAICPFVGLFASDVLDYYID